MKKLNFLRKYDIQCHIMDMTLMKNVYVHYLIIYFVIICIILYFYIIFAGTTCHKAGVERSRGKAET